MKTNLSALLCASLIFLCSCGTTGTRDVVPEFEEILIDAQNQHMLSMDSIIKEVRFVRLETAGNNFIGIISQLLIADSFFVVVDSRFAKTIHVFNIAFNGMPVLDKQITSDRFSEYCRKYFFFNGDFIELQDLTYINIRTPTGNPFVVYSHANKQTFFSTEQGSHPLFPFLKNQEPIARFGENTVVFAVSAFHLMLNKEEWYKHEPDRQFLENLYGDLTEESNLVLVLCELNENIGNEKQ